MSPVVTCTIGSENAGVSSWAAWAVLLSTYSHLDGRDLIKSDLLLSLLCSDLIPSRNEEYIAPAKAKAIQRLLVDLCAELRGNSVLRARTSAWGGGLLLGAA
jgi:hypothetical protein